MRVDSGADGRSTERDLRELFLRRPAPLDPALDLSGVTEELLTESNRRRVLQMRAPGLDDAPKFLGLGIERGFELT